ncbi:phenylalanine--tRNA ligase subunit alpha [Treponema brennaborense]|uniref:Phenylalanine--tRNA ligase alpha subunit n=1 Tax=Treponema brennaborense (strain DSM 12168 / CIP 105900 / DD5/3) TaxID=906968 RepID=F4LM70_TREBD|nr:phenylalanine--tRNA ligase subunit alpha [Treponema brennaborense]AEE17736.1 Phenylalanyl-tRNA synthetase alpha chain [Treponema brennaborense DSM 12168]
MDVQTVIKNLHPLEIRVLLSYSPADELTAARLQKELSYKEGHANQAFSWLAGKELAAVVRRENHTFFELTELGRSYAQTGTPEERIVAFLKESGAHTLPEIAAATGIENKDVGSAFGTLSKEGVLAMNAEKKASYTGNPLPPRAAVTAGLLKKAAAAENGVLDQAALSAGEKDVVSSLAKKRGAADAPFRMLERETVVYKLTGAAADVTVYLKKAGITGNEIGSLTSKMLSDGSWKNGTFRGYNISVPPARIIPGRTNPYVSFLESVKDKLCSLGFEEFDGPLVETEFWNSDALFMPQFHAARDIHDVYYVKNPTHATKIDEPFLSNVAAAHENGGNTGSRGWNYTFDRDFTRRLILRSQGTVLSAHQLAKAKIPGKYFGIARCFRYDKVDATHLSDFYQTEGIVLGNEVNLKTLLGFLEMFAVEIAGATDVKYVPGYFPFTEPSIEVHIKHPVLGWFELGGSGIFRPEVTKAMGIDVPVLAWGIGIDRMALMALGLNDLRELFSTDIEQVRLRKARY